MPENKNAKTEDMRRGDANRDPITGAPGSHPVGTGVGAAAGGAAGAAGGLAAGAAMGTAGAGPIGGAVGAAIGAVVGGLAGKGVSERVNPTEEDAYWNEHHSGEPYYDRSFSYDDYRGAYRTGYEGFARLGSSGKRYEEIEPDLRREYEQKHSSARLPWDKARPAVRAAWQRFDRDLERYIGYDVVDRNANNIGTLECLWADHRGEPAFVGVRTGWFLGKTHVVPAQSVEVSEQGQRLRLPYTEDQVKDAPAYDAETDMTDEKEQEVYSYYGVSGAGMASSRSMGTGASSEGMASMGRSAAEREHEAHTRDEATMQLSEEQLRVDKREIDAGGVRLRKVIRTEVVNQPVELRREEVVIERVPADEMRSPGRASFEEQEVYIPLRREEAVVQKEAHVREEIRARKSSQTDTQQVTERVRREDVEVERSGEVREDPTRRSRSQS
jgi:uncharacterized protein (TIGR02271 family)